MEDQTGDKLVQELREQVGNLLAASQLLTPLVREQGGKKEMDYLAMMNQSLYRLLRTIAHLELTQEKAPTFRPVTLDLAGLCLELGRKVETLAGQAGVEFRCELGEETLLTAADGGLVELALLNLISNAIEAAGPGGHVGLKLSRKGALAILTVRDDGPGLSKREEAGEDPYLKEAGGLGLGLAAARRTAALHGGALVLENREEGGVRAVLSLPIRNQKEDIVRSPRMGYDLTGGFSTALVELSRVLPYTVFMPETLD